MGTTENQLIFENNNPQKHYKETIAKQIFESDIEMNSMVYARNTIMYLYVNANNHSKITFNENSGFAKKFYGIIKCKGKGLEEYLSQVCP